MVVQGDFHQVFTMRRLDQKAVGLGGRGQHTLGICCRCGYHNVRYCLWIAWRLWFTLVFWKACREKDTKRFGQILRVCPHVKARGRWKVVWLIMPARKRHSIRIDLRGFAWQKDDTKGRWVGRITLVGPLGKVQITCWTLSGFLDIMHIQKLQHAIAKEKATIGSTLARVRVAGPFSQAHVQQSIGHLSLWFHQDEHVIKL